MSYFFLTYQGTGILVGLFHLFILRFFPFFSLFSLPFLSLLNKYKANLRSCKREREGGRESAKLFQSGFIMYVFFCFPMNILVTFQEYPQGSGKNANLFLGSFIFSLRTRSSSWCDEEQFCLFVSLLLFVFMASYCFSFVFFGILCFFYDASFSSLFSVDQQSANRCFSFMLIFSSDFVFFSFFFQFYASCFVPFTIVNICISL